MLTDTFDGLVRAEITVWDAVDARLRAEHGVMLGRFQVLRALALRTADGSGCRVNDIAEDLLVTVGGVSKLVDRLENAGFCCRRANPADRRSSLLELTDDGRRLLGDAVQTVEDELSRRFSALDESELRQLTAVLAKLDQR